MSDNEIIRLRDYQDRCFSCLYLYCQGSYSLEEGQRRQIWGKNWEGAITHQRLGDLDCQRRLSQEMFDRFRHKYRCANAIRGSENKKQARADARTSILKEVRKAKCEVQHKWLYSLLWIKDIKQGWFCYHESMTFEEAKASQRDARSTSVAVLGIIIGSLIGIATIINALT